MKSEFGRGLVICLLKFAEHFERNMLDFNDLMQEVWSETNQKTCKECYGSNKELYLSNQIEIWANGASDHLYEIKVPEGKDWDKIRRLVKKLQAKGLEMGHGFGIQTWSSKNDCYTIKDFEKLKKLTYEICLLIDKKLGLKPDIGTW